MLVVVGGREVQRLEYNGQAVVTLNMVGKLHNNGNSSRQNFNNNKGRFAYGLDYHFVKSFDDAKKITGHSNPNGVTLLTESGHLKLVKTFTDDLAWQVQGQLIDCYFHVKKQPPPVEELTHVNTAHPPFPHTP